MASRMGGDYRGVLNAPLQDCNPKPAPCPPATTVVVNSFYSTAVQRCCYPWFQGLCWKWDWCSLMVEFFGTAFLVFIGSGVALEDLLFARINPISPVVFGLILFALTEAFYNISGAHFNPLVTLMYMLTPLGCSKKGICWLTGILYWIAQFAGAVVGGVMILAFVSGTNLGTPESAPGVSHGRVFAMEFFASLVFYTLVLFSFARGYYPALAVGAAFTCALYISGPVSGGGINPFRYLGTAIISWSHHDGHNWWIYIVGPLVACIGALIIFEFCCWLSSRRTDKNC